MAITKLNSLAIPPNTIVESDLSYPLTNFSSTGIDDNATSTAITIDSSENVGVGTTSPLNKFVVSEGTGQHGIELAPGTTSYIQAYDRAIADYGDLKIDAQIIQFGTDNGTERMRIDSSGNVGIGGSISTAKLYVVGATNDSTQLAIRAQNLATSDLFFVRNDGSMVAGIGSKMTLDASGNLGIGTASPSSMLHLYGTDPILRLQDSAGGDTFGAYVSNLDGFGIYNFTDSRQDLTISGAGNVGIGTTSPSYKLEVVGQTRTDTLLVDTFGGVNSGFLGGRSDWTGGATDNSFAIGSYQSNICFFTNNNATERMRIDSSGNVGINTSSPSGVHAPLTIKNNPSYLGSQINFQNAYTTDFYIGINGDTTGDILYYVGGAKNQAFYTSGTERMRIDSSGNVLVGTTTTVGTGTEGIQLGTNGSIITGRNQTSDQIHHIFKNPNGTVGTIRTLNNATSYVTSSDQRLKENIVDAPAGNIDAIRIRSFDWKADGSHQTYGMVAQELVDVAPEAVSQGETEEDMWGVDYSKLVPMMIKEIQDLKAEVAALKGA